MKTIDNDIKNQDLKRIYLLYGEEAYLIRQYRDKIIHAFFPEPDSMNMTVYQGADVTVPQLVDLAETLPFFAEHRLIVVDGSGLFQKGGEELASYLEEMPASTHILFVEESVDKRSKLYKAVAKSGKAVEFTSQTEEVLQKWILGRLRKEGKSITQPAYQLFIEKTGTDMENIDKELEKLVCYAYDREVVDVEDVQAITTEQTTSKVFEMVDAIAGHNGNRALELYYDLLSLHEPSMRILALVTKQFDTMLMVKSMTNQGCGAREIATGIGRPDWAVRKYQAQCRGYSLEQLKQVVRQGVEYEEAVKTGKLNDQLAVELMILQFSR